MLEESSALSPVVANPPWTLNNDNELRALAMQGKSVYQIAQALKRSSSAIRGRAFKLGLVLGKAKKK